MYQGAELRRFASICAVLADDAAELAAMSPERWEVEGRGHLDSIAAILEQLQQECGNLGPPAGMAPCRELHDEDEYPSYTDE